MAGLHTIGWIGKLSIGISSCMVVGCFVGDAANGLPCEQDADCGIGIACALDAASGLRCCGGSCSDGGTQGGTSTGSLPTTSSTGEASSTSTSAESSSSGTNTDCGNAVLDEGEECDEADNPNCVDCKYLGPCGNGVVDFTLGEVCDRWAVPEGEACSDDCRTWTALAWDADSTAPETARDFEADACGVEDPTCLSWRGGDMGPRLSGTYFPVAKPAPLLEASDPWPAATLLTRPISFPELSRNDIVEISVTHEFTLNMSTLGETTDHGIVALAADSEPASWVRVFPLDGKDGHPIVCGNPEESCFPADASPSFCDEPAFGFAGERRSDTDTRMLVGEDVSEQTLQLAFRLQYDCANFGKTPPPDDAWKVEAVSITVQRP